MVFFAMYLAGSIAGHLYFREHVAEPIPFNWGDGEVGIFGPADLCWGIHRFLNLV